MNQLPVELGQAVKLAFAHNAQLSAFTSLTAKADVLSAFQSAPRGELHGVSVGLKDVFCTKELATTAASAILKNYTSPFDATVVSRLRSAGAVVVGKTNMDEFGMGSTNEHSHFGAVRNPAGPDGVAGALSSARSAGGSSGGSAAAVAAGMCKIALASDTGGSTRLPAAYCGVVGLKPSYGLLSRWGMIAYASSLDCVGVMAKRVEDVELALNVLSAWDPKDPTSVRPAVRQRARALAGQLPARWRTGDLAGLRVGVPAEYFLEEVSPAVLPPFRRALRQLQARGATLHSVSIPSTPLALSAYYVLASAEASSNLARFDGIRYGTRANDTDSSQERTPLYAATRSAGFGREVQKRILLGTYALSAEAFDNFFLQAQRVRRLLQLEFADAFRCPSPLAAAAGAAGVGVGVGAEGVDVLVHPSAIGTAPVLGAEGAGGAAGYVQDVLNVGASLAGLPGVSVPAGRAEDGWPVGVQVVGQWGMDGLVLDVARALEGE